MRAQRSGLVVAMSSTAGIVGQESCTAYAAAKFGVEGWIESLTPRSRPSGSAPCWSSRAFPHRAAQPGVDQLRPALGRRLCRAHHPDRGGLEGHERPAGRARPSSPAWSAGGPGRGRRGAGWPVPTSPRSSRRPRTSWPRPTPRAVVVVGLQRHRRPLAGSLWGQPRQHRPANSLHHGHGGRTRIPPRELLAVRPRRQPGGPVRWQKAAVASSCRLPRGQRCPSGSLCSAARTWPMMASGPCSARTAQEAGPVEQAEAVNQAGSAVAEHGRSVQALAGNGVDKGVVGGGRVGAGDPKAVGMVAVAALFGD